MGSLGEGDAEEFKEGRRPIHMPTRAIQRTHSLFVQAIRETARAMTLALKSPAALRLEIPVARKQNQIRSKKVRSYIRKIFLVRQISA